MIITRNLASIRNLLKVLLFISSLVVGFSPVLESEVQAAQIVCRSLEVQRVGGGRFLTVRDEPSRVGSVGTIGDGSLARVTGYEKQGEWIPMPDNPSKGSKVWLNIEFLTYENQVRQGWIPYVYAKCRESKYSVKPLKFVWPVPFTKRISQNFGLEDGGQYCYYCGIHKGVDISAANIYGKDIVSIADGYVLHVGEFYYSDKRNPECPSKPIRTSTFGPNAIIIQHTNGLYSLYGHASRAYVRAGEFVSAGQRIAAVGSEGNSTGPHLHLEVVKGKPYSGDGFFPFDWNDDCEDLKRRVVNPLTLIQ